MLLIILLSSVNIACDQQSEVHIRLEFIMCMCAGVEGSLPRVHLRDIPGLRWVLTMEQFLPSESATKPCASVALWAVDSLQRRTGTLQAMQLSQVDRHHKTAVGLLRGVEVHKDDSVSMELWFIEDKAVRMLPRVEGFNRRRLRVVGRARSVRSLRMASMAVRRREQPSPPLQAAC